MKYNYNKVYIVFDGTSHYAVYGCDVKDEIEDNDVEVVDGPFDEWNDAVDDKIYQLNDDAYRTYMYR